MNDNNQYGYGSNQRGPYSTPEQRPFGQVPPESFRPLPPPRKRRTGRVVAIVVGLCLLGILTVGSCTALMFDGAIDATKADSAPHITPPSTPPGPAVPSPTTKPGTKKVAPSTVPRDGMLFVGKDVKPGTYRTTVPADSFGCYAARLKDTDGELTSIIANHLYTAGSQAVLTVKATDYAVEVRCDGARWELVK
jgi:hypothetical protein